MKEMIMKDIGIHAKIMMRLMRILSVLLLIMASAVALDAQNSLPAPGAGGSYRPAPIGGGGWRPGGMGPGPGMTGIPGPPPGPVWGSPWGPGWSSSPTIVVNSPSWSNQGTTDVVAVGYDNRGIWRTIPLHVAYYFTGVNYDVTVLSAYNPWTGMWNRGLNRPAFNTDFYLRGESYGYYTTLSTGTYYFNL